MTTMPGPRIGVLVVAYNAATTLAQTLSRLPDAFTQVVEHVLVCDDASTDDTYEVGLRFKSGSTLPLTVMRHQRNLGYGGNQKVGYAWAIEHGLDIVVLLHGDGQYAPECIEDLVAPLVSGDADAVFGSRMLVRGDALRGGMPPYKYVGNRILTRIQNRLTGLALSEWHSGYRAYRVDALGDLDLTSYSDGFDFDTEIILGLAGAQKRIVEVPIPTYYGDEICRVNGISYAKDVTLDTIRHWARQQGFGGGVASSEADEYALKTVGGSHDVLLGWLAARPPSRVLDAGCFDGRFADLARRQGHHVTGMDRVKYDGVADRVDAFLEADLNQPLPESIEQRVRRHRRRRHPRARGRAAAPARRPGVQDGPRRTRSWCRCRTSDTGIPAAASPSVGSTTTSVGRWTGATCASSRATPSRHSSRPASCESWNAARSGRRSTRCSAGARRRSAPGVRGRQPRGPSVGARLAAAVRLPVPLPAGARVTSAPPSRRRQQISTGSGLFVGGLAYVLTLLQYGHDLTRTALAPGYFSQFFDLQGRAILDGRLSLPEGSLSIEGFVHDGQTYTYFPPFPALIRLPVLMTTHEYDGRLTLLSMAAAWIVFAVMLAKLIWFVMPRVAGTTDVTRTQAVLAGLFLGGSVGRVVPDLRREPAVGLPRGLRVGRRGCGRRPLLDDTGRLRARQAQHLVALRVRPHLRGDPCHRGARGLRGRDRPGAS